MKNNILFLVFLAVLIGSTSFAQSENHKWKVLFSGAKNVWYDGTQLDTVSSSRFDLWIIELHKPALTLDGVAKKITRTKTLYSVDREIGKYGLKKVVYYNNVSTELARYSYESDDSTGTTKYYFPIINSELFDGIFKELDKKTAGKK